MCHEDLTAEMKAKTIYLVLCFAGAVLPYWPFIKWLSERGFNSSLFVRELFTNRISTFLRWTSSFPLSC
jgi:hypothetical protein